MSVREPRKKGEILSSIRKPTAPPSKTFGEDKADEKAYPGKRKVKHKKKIERDNGDL
jgi:hypothetical protein